MSNFDYSTEFDPAMPVCDAALQVRSTGRQVLMRGIIDTGADASIVPISFLRALRAQRAFATRMRSQWGELREVFLYLVDVRLGDIILPGLYVVADEQGTEVILGRNVLNRVTITLDGPKSRLKIAA